jgi:hypothetical protein
MEQVPHWLMVTVFAAGMTAYAEDVDGSSSRIAADPAADETLPQPPIDSIH